MIGAPSVGEALDAFRHAHGLAADEQERRSWTCRLGPLTLRLPNWHWRRRAILAHDLHHVLTGIPCTLAGECQMAAWELGAGPMPHWGARLFCQPLVLIGLLWTPRRVWRAYLAGRRSQTLHRTGVTPGLLATPLGLACTAFHIPFNVRAKLADRIRFAILISGAAAMLLAPVLPALWLLLAA